MSEFDYLVEANGPVSLVKVTPDEPIEELTLVIEPVLSPGKVRQGPLGTYLLLSAHGEPTDGGLSGESARWFVLDTSGYVFDNYISTEYTIDVSAEYPVDVQADMLRSALAQSARLRTEERKETVQVMRTAEAFRDRVREYAITAHEDGEICASGLDRFLDDMGMDAYQRSFSVQVRVNVTATVIADDESEATQILFDALTVDTDDEDDRGMDIISDVNVENRDW